MWSVVVKGLMLLWSVVVKGLMMWTLYPPHLAHLLMRLVGEMNFSLPWATKRVVNIQNLLLPPATPLMISGRMWLS